MKGEKGDTHSATAICKSRCLKGRAVEQQHELCHIHFHQNVQLGDC
jgi:hypothetical protein